jgi:hypothetical protein
MIFMRAHKHWLDYDVVALAFLIIGIAAVELFALIFWLQPHPNISWACLSAGPHHLALTRSHALFYLVSIFVGSLQTIVNVLTYVRRAWACGCGNARAQPLEQCL